MSRRHLSIFLALTFLAPLVPAEGIYSADCQGVAPLQFACDGGVIYVSNAYYRWDIVLPPCPGWDLTPCYVGDIQLVMKYSWGEKIRTCSVIALPGVDPDIRCTHAGQPWYGGPSTFLCYSMMYGTASPEPSGDGVPGGVGSWGCYFRAR